MSHESGVGEPSTWAGRYPVPLAIGVAVLVLIADYFTGERIRFPLLFIVPVALASWHGQKWLAISFALLMPAARVGFHFPWHETQSLRSSILNNGISSAALLIYGYLIHRTAWQTAALSERVQLLEGMLPICAWCKRIRDDDGEYETVEQYLAEHTGATFTHGICPECAAKMEAEMQGAKG